MRIFFGFSRSELFNAMRFKNISEDVNQFFFRECNRKSESFIIACHCCIMQVFANSFSVESVKVFKHHSFRNFSCPIRSIVEENNRIIIVDAGFFTADDCRENEFIVVAARIRSFNAFNCGCSVFTFTEKKSVVTFFNAFPAVVTVHNPVSSDYGCNRRKIIFFQLIFNSFKEGTSTLRRCITTVKESVYVNFFKPVICGKFNQGKNVIK